MLQNH